MRLDRAVEIDTDDRILVRMPTGAIHESAIARYKKRDLMRFFRADAAFAIPELYGMLEAEGYFYTIRLKGNAVLQEAVAHRLKRPVGRPPDYVRRFYHDFEYQAASWGKARRVIAKVEWHPGDLFPRVGFVVPSLPMEPEWVIRFYNQRGTAEQHIKEGKYAINWTRVCPANGSGTMRSGFSFTLWPTIRVTSLAVLTCQRKLPSRTPCPQDHIPAGRGCCGAQRLRTNPCCDPQPQTTAEARVTGRSVDVARKRLNTCVLKAPKGAKTGENPGDDACDALKITPCPRDMAVRLENRSILPQDQPKRSLLG